MHKAGLANTAASRSRKDGLELRDAWVTVAVRCAPPDNKPLPLEKKKCSGFLDRELAMLPNMRVVVCLGSFAYVAACEFFGVSPRPKFAHGAEVRVPAGTTADDSRGAVTLVCSYHPSQQNTFTGRLTERMLDDVFARATSLAKG
jgi:uracil-DNA glycosylase family 4